MFLPMLGEMELPFFFQNNGHRIFAILHSPDDTNINAGFVFCYPFATEGECCRRIYTQFARWLASKGYYVLRFNYMGTGDSSGNFEDATVQTRVSDIIRAVDVLYEKCRILRIGLLGMRLGATWAGLSAIEHSSVPIDPLVLWDPILNVRKFLDTGLRQSIAFQSFAFRQVIFNRKQIAEKLISNGKVEYNGYLLNVIDGHPIGRDFYVQSADVEPLTHLEDYSGNLLIVQIDKNAVPLRSELANLVNIRKRLGKAVDVRHAIEPISWWDMRVDYRVEGPKQLFDVTGDWIEKVMKSGIC